MAKFTRAELRNILGDAHTEEIENKLIALHLGVVDPMKDQINQYKAEADKVEELTKELQAAKDQLSKAGDADKVRSEFDAYKKQVEGEKAAQKKGDALEKLLETAGVARPSARALIRKGYDLNGIELLEDGSIKDADKITASIKTEYADFIGEKGTYGTPAVTPPNGGVNQGRRNPESVAARIAASYHENLYGKKE